MASGLGVTLGIVAGAAVVGLTAGLAAPAVGAAATSLLAGTAFSSSWAIGAGALALGAGMAVTQSPAQPEPISQVGRQLLTTSDPEAPWEWVYGEVIKGAALVWIGVGGDEDHWSGGDYVIACHPCEELLGVQIGEWYLPIVTTIDGDTNANGLGLMLNTGQALSTQFPATWYVPVHGGANGNSAWWRGDQGDNDTPDEAHVAIRFMPGTQTVTDAEMASKFGAKYSDVDRKFIGHTVAHVIFLANTELGTLGGIPDILWHVKGKSDIQDHTGGNAQYRNNAAYVFADYCREQLGIAATEIVNLQAAATECNDTTWSGAGTDKRFVFDGVIRDDMEPTEALRLISTHMAGGYSERGDEIYLWTGSVKAASGVGPITQDDVAGRVETGAPDEDAWANTILPHFIVQRPLNEDGQRQLHGKMEPAKHDVTSATYVTEDDGEVLRQDAKFQACILGRRAKFMAWIVLKQQRLGVTLQGLFKKRLMVLEVGDVISMSLPEFAPNGTEFQVASRSINPLTFSVELGFVRYEDDIYIPGTTPTEDAIGVVPRNRSTIMPPITGLAAEVEEDSAQVNVHGRQTIDVVVSWDLVPNRLVRAAGDVRVSWKKQSNSWPGRSTTVSGDEIQAVLPGLLQNIPYHIRARAEGTGTAGRFDKPRGPWTANLPFTPNSGFISAGRPGTPTLSHNELTNPNFRQRSEGWQYVSAATGTIDWIDMGGRFGTASTRLTVVSDDLNIRPDAQELIPVEVGQRRRFRFWRRITVADVGVTVDVVLRALYYSSENVADLVSTTLIGSLSTDIGTDGYKLVTGHHTVPDDPTIVAMRIEAAAKYTDGPYTVRFDAFQQKRVLGATGPMLTDITTLNGGNTGAGSDWTTLRSITVGKPGDPVGLSFSWESRVGDPGNLTNIATLRIRVQRFDADGTSNETNILPAMAVGNEFTPDGGHAVAWSRWEALIANCSDDSLDAGTFIYRAQFSTDRTGAQAAVRNRIIGWRLESAGA